VVGGGTGEFLGDLLASGFAGSVVYVDVSAAMLRRARQGIARRFPEAPARVEFLCGDLLADLPGETFDLVCTHYLLDLFAAPDELHRAMGKLDERLSTRGIWLCSDFSVPSGGAVRRTVHRAFIRALYGFFGWSCGVELRALPGIETEFSRIGYTAMARSDHFGGLLWSAVYRRTASLPSERHSPCPTGSSSESLSVTSWSPAGR